MAKLKLEGGGLQWWPHADVWLVDELKQVPCMALVCLWAWLVLGDLAVLPC